MRLHGSVSLALLVFSQSLYGQEAAVPQPLDRQAVPDLIAVPQPTGPVTVPTRPIEPARPLDQPSGPSALEYEIEALRSDLQSFHALSDEVARSARTAEAEADRAMIRQRQEMLDILTKLATQGLAKKAVENPEERKRRVIEPAPEPIAAPAVTDTAVDHFALGKVLFRAGEYAKAEQAFRKVAVTEENRLLVKYLVATCLRKRSQWPAAIEGYREVAASDKDPVLRDLAKFQLDGIQWNQETEKQIEQLRKQREKQAKPSKSPE